MKTNKNRRLLCRSLAKELKPQDLGLSELGLVKGGDPPPSSTTMMATLPDYHEDA